MDNYTQTSLELFEYSSFDELMLTEGIAGLTVKFSSRMVKSWNVRISNFTGSRLLCIPAFMEKAPNEIKLALIKWALLPLGKLGRKKNQPLRVHLESIIHQYISTQHKYISGKSSLSHDMIKFATKGNQYDLTTIFNDINSIYFGNSIKSHVRWGSCVSTTSYQTTKTDGNGTRYHLITIAGVYNHPDVPRFAIDAVMYHEMLHIKIPPYKKNGRNVIHGPEFKKAERQFKYFDEWHQWEKLYLFNMAKQMKEKNKRKSKKKFKFF
ncbi:MAG: hypothetical protein Q4F84_09695 [Fibrobacter sp.]|nr:hypothetical protein [Fibrobacter sp.]